MLKATIPILPREKLQFQPTAINAEYDFLKKSIVILSKTFIIYYWMDFDYPISKLRLVIFLKKNEKTPCNALYKFNNVRTILDVKAADH